MERTIPENRREQCDAGVEGEADGSDRQHRFRGGKVQFPQVDGEGDTEKKEGKLQHNGQRVDDQAQPPLLESDEFGLVCLPSIDDVPPRWGSGIIQDPLFRQHRDEGDEQRDGQTDEEDGLSSEDAGGDTRDRCQRVDSSKRSVLLQYSEQQDVCQVGGVRLELWNDLDNERGRNCREQTRLTEKSKSVSTDRMLRGHKHAHKKQGGVQVSEVFRSHVGVTFVSNLLVGGPEVCGWICPDGLGFPIFNRPLQPKQEEMYQSKQTLSKAGKI